MKQLVLFTGVILMSCVIISSVVMPARAEQGNIGKITETIEQHEENTYVIKSDNGNLSVYIKGENTPVVTTDTNISVLPKEDQLLLEKGIEVKGEKELHKALEDYCS
ncbi:MAG: hypothetical protein PUD24_06985 [Oscillospiraceae bacterium]|nr:hypothetical protein [Oscillospiraceae bacterium]